MNPGHKVVLGYPVGGSVTLPFHASVIRLLGYEMAKPDAARLLARITHSSGLYVAENRTELSQQFLAGTGDWLLMIDTDIEFPATLLETLLALAGTSRKILAASVPLGAYATCAFNRTEKAGVWQAVPVPLEPVAVDGVATAVALIHRSVFETIAAQHGQSWWHHVYLPAEDTSQPGDFRSQGEDLAFSIKAASCGIQSWAVHVPGIGHYKTRRLSHDTEFVATLPKAPSLHGDTPGLGVLVEA